MGKIGGNIAAVIQYMAGRKDNGIGQSIPVWETAMELIGWLDLQDGDAAFEKLSAKIQESTHVFICDYSPLLVQAEDGKQVELTPENSRMVIEGKIYEAALYDDPMGMHSHLELYLKYMGGVG